MLRLAAFAIQFLYTHRDGQLFDDYDDLVVANLIDHSVFTRNVSDKDRVLCFSHDPKAVDSLKADRLY